MIKMKILENKTITDVQNFLASGISGGLKKSGKKDLCVIYSKVEAVGAAVFTTNKVKAAPVLLNMENIKNDNIQVIVVNSGNANSCTGKQGMENAMKMAETAAECLGLSPKEVLVQSTGLIGLQLPMDKIIPAIKKGCSMISPTGGSDAAVAIKTTDTFSKSIAVEFEIDGKKVMMSGIAKGSGMVHPNMATMLSFIVTDANITKEMLNKAFKNSVDDSYNMISVDGDTSTNDMSAVLANKCAGNTLIDSEDEKYFEFKKALDFVNKELAKMIAKDGEGATKLLEVTVKNGKDIENSKLCAKSIIRSNLTKCAFFGADANWGRIMCSIGYSGADFDPEKVDIFIKGCKGEIQVAKDGMGLPFDEILAKEILLEEYVNVIVDLKDGNKNATAWGCDLTYDYVKINGCYRT
ncbi:bifunctional glutamate N-acetyltransferase/amino-acid acetyltransferase ArgJ [Oceanirhabdus sp. W0125-5]|uniref:bifunctional glutamate N-acetyltransferase/amino-acid acetyltransferase ArgJ n=1 Tax=Oceanirhabdus sp. W0125-5 TaxID=2999116 RepID=UPI0022F2BBD1|nr:bifunctional glutamate N-acetyltransferase/amino-acid acetyltransferase ArgJ [Oceanirhabdus sp. W0125-5]WBW95698.1 bifunctional glutamate N-acetyltransferase/amino-acid acetyltransferase ArgJ [Oceanirhabdus sp. W0125-5]